MMLRAGLHTPRLYRSSLAELQRGHAGVCRIHRCASAGRKGHCLLLQQHNPVGLTSGLPMEIQAKRATPAHGMRLNIVLMGA